MFALYSSEDVQIIVDRKCRIVRYNKVSLVWTCVRTCDAAAFGSIRLTCCALFLATHFEMHAHIKDASTNLSYVHVNCESNIFGLHVDAHRAFGGRIRACKGRILGAHFTHLNKNDYR